MHGAIHGVQHTASTTGRLYERGLLTADGISGEAGCVSPTVGEGSMLIAHRGLLALQFIQVFNITTVVYQFSIKSLVMLSKYLLVLRNLIDVNHLWKHPCSIRNTSIFILISTSWHSSTKILYFSQSGFIYVIEARLKTWHLRRYK